VIGVVCLSPAIDVTYQVNNPVLGEVNRIDSIARRPGGKGLNVARILKQLGANPVLYAPLGGTSGDWIRQELDKLEIQSVTTPIATTTRQAITIFSEQVTVFNEPATDVTGQELALLGESVGHFQVIVVSGSIPKSITPPAFTAFLQSLGSKCDQLVVDTSGEYLLAASQVAQYLKPNLEELLAATGLTKDAALEEIRKHGAKVILSMGRDGIALYGAQTTTARAPIQIGNPTGAGDALVAGFSSVLAGTAPDSDSESAALRFGCALSAASVRSPIAGEFDNQDLSELLNQIEVT
jgi:tagatose 6-phosphate kinase